MSSQYEVRIEVVPEELGGGFHAYAPTLGKFTIYGAAATKREALEEFEECMQAMFEYWESKGIAIPAPTLEDMGHACIPSDGDFSASNNYAYAA